MTHQEKAIDEVVGMIADIIRDSAKVDDITFGKATELLAEIRYQHRSKSSSVAQVRNLLAKIHCQKQSALSENCKNFLKKAEHILNFGMMRDNPPKSLDEIIADMNFYAEKHLNSKDNIEDVRNQILAFVDKLKSTLMMNPLHRFNNDSDAINAFTEETGNIVYGTPSIDKFLKWLFGHSVNGNDNPDATNEDKSETAPFTDGGIITHVEVPNEKICIRCKKCPTGCEFLQSDGKCHGVVYPSYPPQYGDCEFLKKTNKELL